MRKAKPSAGIGKPLVFTPVRNRVQRPTNPHPHPNSHHIEGRLFAAPSVNQRYSHVDTGKGASQGEAKGGGRRNHWCYESGAKNIFHDPTTGGASFFLEVISFQISQVHNSIASTLGQLSSNIDASSYVPLMLSTLGFLTSHRLLVRITRTSRRHIAPYSAGQDGGVMDTGTGMGVGMVVVTSGDGVDVDERLQHASLQPPCRGRCIISSAPTEKIKS